MFKIGWTQLDINQFLTASLHWLEFFYFVFTAKISVLMGKGVANDWRKMLMP